MGGYTGNMGHLSHLDLDAGVRWCGIWSHLLQQVACSLPCKINPSHRGVRITCPCCALQWVNNKKCTPHQSKDKKQKQLLWDKLAHKNVTEYSCKTLLPTFHRTLDWQWQSWIVSLDSTWFNYVYKNLRPSLAISNASLELLWGIDVLLAHFDTSIVFKQIILATKKTISHKTSRHTALVTAMFQSHGLLEVDHQVATEKRICLEQNPPTNNQCLRSCCWENCLIALTIL